jgi:hypothetical protein
MVSNQTPFKFNFIFGNRKKAEGVKSGEYSEWGMCFVFHQKPLGEDGSADVNALLLLVSCQNPGHKFCCNTVQAQLFVRTRLHIP